MLHRIEQMATWRFRFIPMLALSLGSVPTTSVLAAGQNDFTEFQSGQLVSVLRQISGLTSFMPETLFLEGVLQTKEMNLIARTITFSPDTQLVFPSSPLSGQGNSIFIVADTIKLSGDVSIVWVKPAGQSPLPPRGQAPDGIAAREPSQPGSRGYDGETGNSGIDGAAAPGIVLLFRHIIGEGRISIDVSGMDGQRGGDGQNGGRGGAGAAGADSIGQVVLKNFFVSQGCIRPPTSGGAGGDGGDGGSGGRGGNGGSSGDVLIFTTSQSELKHLDVDHHAGLGADSGNPGNGGPGGAGGPAGRDIGGCGAQAQNGLDGVAGKIAGAGLQGGTGLTGVLGFGLLSERQLDTVLNPAPRL